MKQLIENIVLALVDDPSAVEIEEILENDQLTIKIHAGSQDLGKIIGKQGKIAKSIRTIAKACAIKENVQVNIEIVD